MTGETAPEAVRPPQPPAPTPARPQPSPQPPSLLLDDQLCFALYAAQRAVTARYRPLLEALGLTYPQYLTMLVLWERDAVAVRDLGAALQLESSTLSPLLKRLEAHGLVRRERRADDERSVEIRLTSAGRELREKARTVPLDMGAAMALTPEQDAAAKQLLRRLTANVSGGPEAAGGPGTP
ncbi:MarR family transcriptional regulator [Streptomyces sp. NPDC048290]|uniref:MarR family winged helix-turn-helix transcriptional regulator n=1 Tax=Streptomyces sp. NPDC048290 TaxID=3155811 RepID=UPI003412E7F2